MSVEIRFKFLEAATLIASATVPAAVPVLASSAALATPAASDTASFRPDSERCENLRPLRSDVVLHRFVRAAAVAVHRDQQRTEVANPELP
jgi:hypothetical protein